MTVNTKYKYLVVFASLYSVASRFTQHGFRRIHRKVMEITITKHFVNTYTSLSRLSLIIDLLFYIETLSFNLSFSGSVKIADGFFFQGHLLSVFQE